MSGDTASGTTKLGVAGAVMMAVTFGMVRYAFGLTLPALRTELGVGDAVLGLIASGTFLGFLLALAISGGVARRRGPRAPIVVGGLCAAVGCLTVAVAPSPGVLAPGALVAGSAAGWVWTSYSTLVAAVVPPGQRPRLLALITTGAAAGLVVVGVLALIVGPSWRGIWAGLAVAAALATLLTLRWVPRVPALPRESRRRRGTGIARTLAPPLGFAVLLFGGATAYFTYAGDAAEKGGLGAVAGPVVFVLVGVTGLVGVGAGTLAGMAGARMVAVVALLDLGVALGVLAAGSGSLAAVVVSALLFGAANTVGAAALPLWGAELVPDDPAAAFTIALFTGSVSAAVTPAVIGALTPHIGLTTVLLAVAVLVAVAGVGLLLVPRRR